jgi:malate dehydrogenase
MFSIRRNISSSRAILHKVCIVGAAGGIGQPLSLLMKMNTNVTNLSLYDIVNTPGVAADLSHINTNSKCVGYLKNDIAKALKDCDVVIVPAGVPRKPGMTRFLGLNIEMTYSILTLES